MKVGASTGCLYPLLTEEAVRTLAENGFEKIEIFFNTFSELEEKYLNRIRDILDEYGISVVSLHPFTSAFESYLLFSGYERRFWDGVKLYDKYFRCVSYLGGKYVVLHGLRKQFVNTSTERLFLERFAILSRRAKDMGVDLLQENVNNYFADNPQSIKRMIDAIPNEAQFVLDIKQATRAGFSPFEILQAMGNRVKHIHISDVSNDGKCLLPGQGDFDFRAFFRFLKQLGYKGEIILEVYRQCFDTPADLANAGLYIENSILNP